MNNSKRLGLASLALLAAIPMVQGAPVSPETALGEAMAFRSSNSGYYRKAPAAQPVLTLAYTATGDKGNCFYIFNEQGGGFTIVTADDRLPRVIGFSENGEFNYEDAPENMKWWLSEYTGEITAFLTEDPKLGKRPLNRANRQEREEIKPLLTSKWDQTEPYNNQCPIDPRTGRRSVTGCVATAMAQVMRHYKWPINPTGSNDGYVFNGTTLDWDNMLDEYLPGKYSSTQADAVALLMRECGSAVSMQYSSYESGAYSNDVQVALRTYFDYDSSLQMEWRDYHTLSEWNDMVYNELAANRPIYYSGRSAQGGHAFVCDGYLANNFFHFNWGWGGYQDGYFLLNSLNPSSGGTGSYAGGYNTDQSIITGVVKNTGSGNEKLQVTMLCTGDFTYAKDNTYRVTGSNGNDLIYNPLGYPIRVNFGLKFTNIDNESKVVYQRSSTSTTYAPYYGTPEIVCTTPSLPAGTYRVSPAIYTEYDEWTDIQVPYGYQRFVTLKVEGGKNTFTNGGPEIEGQAKLLAGAPEYVDILYSNMPKAYKVTVSNVGDGDFFGEVGLSLWYEDDYSGDGDEEVRQIAIPAHSSMDVEFFLSNTKIKPGHYSVFVLDNRGREISEPLIINYPEGDFSKYKPEDVTFNNITPTFPVLDGPLGVSMEVENSSFDDHSFRFEVALLNPADLSEVYKLSTSDAVNFPALMKSNLNFVPREIPIEPGDYYWVARDMDGNWLSLPMPVKAIGAVKEENGIAYQVTDQKAKTAMVVRPVRGDYEGSLTIPTALGGYNVNRVKADAFTFCDALNSVSLPVGVDMIQNGQFYETSKLRNLTVLAQNPPMLAADAFAKDAQAKTVLSTAQGLTNMYMRTKGWDAFKASSWDITIGDGVTVTDGLQKDPATGAFYAPYYVNAYEQLRIYATTPANKVIGAEWSFDGQTGSQAFWQRTLLPALNGAAGQVTLTAIDDTAVDSVLGEGEIADVYNVAGVRILTNASADDVRRLPAGIYIAGGRKIVIRK